MCKPPSTIKVLPVMNDPSEEAIHKMGQAISSGVAQRRSKEVS